jgi:hypothetical protein
MGAFGRNPIALIRSMTPPHPRIVRLTTELLNDHRQRLIKHPRSRQPNTQRMPMHMPTPAQPTQPDQAQ